MDRSLDNEENYLGYNVGMSRLNSDCIIHIFHYLPIVDRFKLARVNKIWYEASRESWHNLKNLDFENSRWGFKYGRSLERINNKILKKVLIRCGHYLLTITFPEYRASRLGPNVLNLIAKYCPNIRNIYGEELDISPWTIRALAGSCSHIVDFYIGNCLDECDDELELLFTNNQGIKGLGVHDNFTVTGRCLLKLNRDNIESIVFIDCPGLVLHYFCVVKNFKNLKKLFIEHFHDTNDAALEDISLCSKSLQYLTLSICPFYSSSLSHLARLTNLVSLDLLSNASVTDETLMAIGLSCKNLKKLDISFCHSVTNNGLSDIISLPNIEYLAIEECNITDHVFNSMPNLKHFDCSHCHNVRDAGLVRLIETCDNIEELYVSHCTKISNELLRAAMRITEKRKKITLKVHPSYTDLKLSEVEESSQFLRVVPDIAINCCSCVAKGFSVLR